MAMRTATNDSSERFTNLYVRNFGPELTESQFRRLFSSYGRITQFKVARDVRGKSKFYGYVNFQTHEMAKNAIDHLHGHRLTDGQRLHVVAYRRKSDREERSSHPYENIHQPCLFVHDLDENIDEKILDEIFSQFGRIVSLRILKSNGRSTGNAFIKFDTRESTLHAQTKMNGQWVRTKHISIELTESFGDEDPSDFSSNVSTTRTTHGEEREAMDVSKEKSRPQCSHRYRYDYDSVLS